MSDQMPERMSVTGRASARLRRHVQWARRDGVARLVEEDRLDPRERVREALARRRWRHEHGLAPGTATGVLVVGVQRSGTNMLTRGLESMPEVEVHNENDRAVFERFQLRSPQVMREVVDASRHQVVLFKPLCDSHDTDRLLAALGAGRPADTGGAPRPARAIWAYRAVDGRVRSAVAKFGDVNQRVLSDIAAGRADGRWQARRLDPEVLEQVRSCDPASLSAESGAALFWWMRNQLFFATGLDSRPDVTLVGYEQVVADPTAELTRVCAFLGLPYRPEVSAHIDRRSAGVRAPLALDPRVRGLCDQLQSRLDEALAQAVAT